LGVTAAVAAVMFLRPSYFFAPSGKAWPYPGLSQPEPIHLGPLSGSLAQYDVYTGQARRVEGAILIGEFPTPEEASKQLLSQSLQSFAKGVTAEDLQVVREANTLTGTQIIYARTFEGLPVLGDRLSVQIAKDDKTVTTIANELTNIESLSGSTLAPQGKLPTDDPRKPSAINLALAAISGSGAISITATPSILAGKQAASAVWEVHMLTRHPAGSWRVLVDADATKVLSKTNIAQFEDGKARLYVPNPVQSSGDASLKAVLVGNIEDYHVANPKLNDLRQLVTLHNLDKSGFLQGDYTSTAPTASRAKEPSQIYDYKRDDPRFAEVMAYFWITECELYLQKLGYTNAGSHKRGINARPMGVDAHFSTEDDSFYSPATKTLQFGDGGVRDAEDAEVIMHEIAHAIQDDQVPGFGGATLHSEARAMGEGFGDYWAASFFSDVGPSTWHVYWDKWDGQFSHPAKDGNPGYFRRLDSKKHYPEDWIGEEHADGEIWSACLWAIHDLVGRERADTTILESHYRIPPGTGRFVDGAKAILAVNQILYSNDRQDEITRIFVDRGILPKP